MPADCAQLVPKMLFPLLERSSGVKRMWADVVPAVPVLAATYWRPSTA